MQSTYQKLCSRREKADCAGALTDKIMLSKRILTNAIMQPQITRFDGYQTSRNLRCLVQRLSSARIVAFLRR